VKIGDDSQRLLLAGKQLMKRMRLDSLGSPVAGDGMVAFDKKRQAARDSDLRFRFRWLMSPEPATLSLRPSRPRLPRARIPPPPHSWANLAGGIVVMKRGTATVLQTRNWGGDWTSCPRRRNREPHRRQNRSAQRAGINEWPNGVPWRTSRARQRLLRSVARRARPLFERAKALGGRLVVAMNPIERSASERRGASSDARSRTRRNHRRPSDVDAWSSSTSPTCVRSFARFVRRPAKGTDYTRTRCPSAMKFIACGGRVEIVGDPKRHPD